MVADVCLNAFLRGCPSVQNDKKKRFCIYFLFHNINTCIVF